MVSGPITSWQIKCEKEGVTDFIFLGSQITADGDHSHEIKRHQLLGRKAMPNLRHCIKNQGHYFADKGLYSQNYGFFQQSCMDTRTGPERRLSAEELILLNCGAG